MIFEYWRDKLSRNEKQIYDILLYNFQNFNFKVELGKINFNDSQIMFIYNCLLNDHPELYYLSYIMRFCTIKNLFVNKYIIEVDCIYNEFERKKMEQQLAILLKQIDKLVENKSDFEKEKIVCQYIGNNVKYMINNIYHQNALHVLVNHIGQCSGIARAGKLLFDHLNIKSFVLNGETFNLSSNGSHAWNVVNIDQQYYHLDLTSFLSYKEKIDDPSFYDYFNYSDDEMQINHKWNLPFPIDKCSKKFINPTKKANYFVFNSLYELRVAIKEMLKNNQKEIKFKFNLKIANLIKEVEKVTLSELTNLNLEKKVKIQQQGNLFTLIIE